MESRTKNSVRNIASGIGNRILQMGLAFVTRTLQVYILGSLFLGLSGLFSSVLTVLSLSELGFGSALVYSMYKPAADGDEKKLCELLNYFRRIYKIIGSATFIIGIALMPFLPKIIKGEVPESVNIYIVYLIFLINSAISYFAFAHKKALLNAYQRNDILSNINSVISIVSPALQIVILLLTKNYYLYIIVLPIFTILENIWVEYITRKKYPNLVCKGMITKEEKKELMEHVKGIALQKICTASRNSVSSIIISMFLGLTAIAMYNNYYYIIISVHNILYMIPNSIRASVGNSIASESLEKNYKDFNTFSFMYLWIRGISATMILCLYQAFMRIWMGDELMLPNGTMILFVIYFVLLSIGDIVALYKDAAGLWWQGRYRVAIEAVANIILNFLFGYLWGINGILIATILTLLFLGNGYGSYIVFKHYLGMEKFSTYIKDTCVYVVVFVSVAFITYKVCATITTEGIVGLVLQAIISLVLSNILFFSIFRKHKYLLNSKALISQIRNTSFKMNKTNG